MKRVRVLYFAAARDAAGRGEEEMELADAIATLGDFARHVAGVHPALGGKMAAVRIARNERFAEEGESIEDGDVLALIPPVAGG